LEWDHALYGVVNRTPALTMLHEMHLKDTAWHMAKPTFPFCFSSDTTTSHAIYLGCLDLYWHPDQYVMNKVQNLLSNVGRSAYSACDHVAYSCFAVWNALSPTTYACLRTKMHCLHTKMQICVGSTQESQETGARRSRSAV
jgi:hypothetical protein